MEQFATNLAAWVWERGAGHVRRTMLSVFMILFITSYGLVIFVAYGLWFGFVPSAVMTGLTILVNAGVIASLWTVPGFEALERWSMGDRRDPQRAFDGTFEVRRAYERASTRVAPVVYVPTLIPAGILLFDLTPVGIAGWVALNIVAPLIMASVGATGLDFLLRPPRLEMAVALGASAQLSSTVSLRRRVLRIGLPLGLAAAILAGAITAPFDDPSQMLAATVGAALLAVVGLGLTFLDTLAVRPLLEPVEDLTAAVQRIESGDYDTPVPLMSDDALGALVVSVNSMQRGLAERERLQSAFGSYVDPALASRLLEQGDETFRGERRDVTVMFVDVRDFTPFAEANSAEDAVTRLNGLFQIVVPITLENGGHVNKYLGDGAMVVFGTPEPVEDHADRSVAAAIAMQQAVRDRFGEELRVGIGINTGPVIAGTIGGGGKLEFTLIGDTVNVAARVEQFTKQTGDAILVTEATAAALNGERPAMVDRGRHQLKGKSADVHLLAIDAFGPNS
ncbi:MAG: adenylate/guanylate cyclase domain-containing protein [Nitriliruptorales bacterium]|nr:adenylate/guanylate cyclase domain-containing protein [Nitriliruptorales bacterium]